MTDNKINVTLKAGEGFAAPWVTIGGDSEAEAAFNLKAMIGDTQTGDFFALVTEAATALRGFYTASDQLGAVAVPAPAYVPAPSTFQASSPGPGRWEAPNTTAPTQQWPQAPAPQAGPPAAQCLHGAMVHRSGSKNGRDWSGNFCPTPKGTVGQCAPVFGA